MLRYVLLYGVGLEVLLLGELEMLVCIYDEGLRVVWLL